MAKNNINRKAAQEWAAIVIYPMKTCVLKIFQIFRRCLGARLHILFRHTRLSESLVYMDMALLSNNKHIPLNVFQQIHEQSYQYHFSRYKKYHSLV